MTDRLQNTFAGVLTLTAALLGAVLIHREFFSSVASAATALNGPPTYASDWKEMITAGTVVGEQTAAVKLIVFSDLECPVCKKYNETLRSVKNKHPHDVALVFVHFPLPMHRFSRPAARAAECAGIGGQFEAFVDLAYAKQDSLGLKSWASYGKEIGVADTVQFAKCASDTNTVARIEAGLALAQRIGVRLTPTIIANGWRFVYPPSETELEKTVVNLVAGKPPYDARGKQASQ